MGLDVYLYRNPDRKLAKRQSADYDAAQAKLREEKYGGKWPHEQTEEVATAQRAEEEKLAAEHNVDRYGSSKLDEKIEMDSPIDPKHLFKIGYFRSSYNSGGINSILRERGMPDLNAIFDAGREYEVTPDWEASLARVNNAIERWAVYSASEESNFDVMEVSENIFGASPTAPTDSKTALSLFMEVYNQHRNHKDDDWSSFSNRDGEFHLNGIKLVAAFPGSADHPLSRGKVHVTYIVFERDKAQWDMCKWVADALAIVRETIEYVIAQPDRANYYMHWSG